MRALDVAREVATLFPHFVDTAKTQQYQALAQARKERGKFATEEEFLASLGIKVTIHRNRRAEAERVAELTQKSNQFNLTTRRYSEAEIRAFMVSAGADVYTLSYKDRFGDQGITGVIIVKGQTIDTFLLSCRILGRGVEFAPWEFVLNDEVKADYIPTAKNDQVRNFWDRLELHRHGDPFSISRHYVGRINSSCPSWIDVKYVD